MTTAKRPNLLFLSIEDLNDYVEPLGGHPQVITPNITRLSQWGYLFRNAYASAPACSPARTAVLFGRWPWETGVYTNSNVWMDAFDPGNSSSFIGRLHEAGYATHGAGKMFYGGLIGSEWDSYAAEPNDKYKALNPLAEAFDANLEKLNFGPVDEPAELYDERNARQIMERMLPGAEGQVWSLGIYRPHLPFVAPRRFFDLYPETVTVAPALKERMFDPFSTAEEEGLPNEAKRRIVKDNPLGQKLYSTQQYNAFLRAYLASISYADFVLGLVLDKLEQAGLRDNTYVVLWSDHGFHFGEKNTFKKFTLWERSLRTPMIFAGPGIVQGQCDHPVSNVDLGPTALRLMGVEPGEAWAGLDLGPQIKGEEFDQLRPVVSVYGWRKRGKGEQGDAKRDLLLAWTVRSERLRVVRYWNGGLEVYDHTRDPYEHNNLAEKGEEENLPPAWKEEVAALEALIPTTFSDAAKEKPRTKAAGQERLPHWARMVG